VRYRLAIFDFDGTLADSFGWFTTVLDDVADRYGFRRVAAGETAVLRRMEPEALLAHLGVARWKLPLIARHMRRLQAEAEIRPFPGAAALLDDLAGAGMRLALVTSNARANVERVLGPAACARFSRFECASGLFGKAGRLRAVLAATGVPASQAVAIGDEVRDIAAARAAGVGALAVGWGYGDPEALAARRPDHLAHDLGELRRLLLGV
jgi:phosphoglycolate phosphatase